MINGYKAIYKGDAPMFHCPGLLKTNTKLNYQPRTKIETDGRNSNII